MKLTIFGATGKTGSPLVRQALAKEYRVTALVRSPAKLSIRHPQLTILQGDVTRAADVDKAVQGADAVLSVIGHVKGSPPHLQEEATRHIVAAMKQHGVERLVTLTGAGVRNPQDQPKTIDRFIGFLLNTLSKSVADDARAHYEVLKQSDVAWTMVRGPRLTDKPEIGEYHTGYAGKRAEFRYRARTSLISC